MTDCPDNAPLGNSISVLSGFPFPSAQFTDRLGKPLIRIRDLIGSRTETNFVGDFDPAFLIRRDDVLIGMDGDFNVVRWKGPEALLNQRVCKVSSASDEVDGRFLYWWLKPHVEIIHHRTPQTTVRHLSVGDLYRIPKPALLAEAQSFAAAALDTVDEAIAKTEAVIAKLRQVRAGLLHDLLTRGLDPHGQLRDPIAHPQQFQDSPLGRIPKEWHCKTLEDAADWFSGGTPSRSQPTWWTGDVPILTPKDMKVFEISDTIEHVTEEAAIAGSKVMPPETAFIVVRGMILAHTFPVCLSTRPFAFNQDIKAVRGREGLKTRFLAHWFAANASAFLRKTTAATHGTKKLDSKELHRAHIGVPGPEEQDAIVGRIEAFDSAIAGETAEVGKLNSLKSGLMTDLLTGRGRVPERIRLRSPNHQSTE